MTSIRPPGLQDTAKLFVLGAIWGSAFLCIEVALRSFAPLTLAAARILLAAILLLGLSLAAGSRLPRDRRTWGRIFLVGLTNATLPFLLISWGQQHISAGMAAILMGAGPFVALALNHHFTADDRLSRPKLFGMVLGFGGVMALVGIDGLGGARSTLWGQLAVITASGLYALSGLLTRRLGHLEPRVSSGCVLVSAAVTTVPLALIVAPPWGTSPSPEAWAALVFLGLISTGFAYLLRFQLIKDTGATFMSQVAYLVPLFGVLWAWLFLGQVPSAAAWMAMVLILIGINISRLRRRGIEMA
jgi:drug/metabolite transporter (DMT)-like permease